MRYRCLSPDVSSLLALTLSTCRSVSCRNDSLTWIYRRWDRWVAGSDSDGQGWRFVSADWVVADWVVDAGCWARDLLSAASWVLDATPTTCVMCAHPTSRKPELVGTLNSVSNWWGGSPTFSLLENPAPCGARSRRASVCEVSCAAEEVGPTGPTPGDVYRERTLGLGSFPGCGATGVCPP